MADLRAKLKIEVAWSSGGYTPGATAFTDESQKTWAVTVQRGRDDELFDMQPSRANLLVDNVGGRFNVQSTAIAVRPGRSVKISGAPGDDTATGYSAIWRGFTETINPSWRKETPTAQIECVDALARFALIANTRSGTDVGSPPVKIIADALNLAGYPGGTSLISTVGPGRNLTTDSRRVTLGQNTTWTNVNLLSQINVAMQNESLGAMAFVANDGRITNHNGLRRRDQTTNDFVMDLNASDIWDYQETISAREVANRIHVNYVGPSFATAEDTASSQVAYGIRDLDVDTLFTAGGATLSTALLASRKDPALRPTIILRNDSSVLLRYILRAELGDQVKMTIASASGSPHKHYYIEGMHLSFHESGGVVEGRYQLTERALTI